MGLQTDLDASSWRFCETSASDSKAVDCLTSSWHSDSRDAPAVFSAGIPFSCEEQSDCSLCSGVFSIMIIR